MSFADEDRELKDELLKHLAVLERIGKIAPWNVDHVQAGADWRSAITSAMKDADLALILVSSGLLAADFSRDAGVRELLAHANATGMQVIPILLRSCLWQDHPSIGRLRALPADGLPIAARQGDARDQALTAIAAEIARKVRRDRPGTPPEHGSTHRAPAAGDRSAGLNTVPRKTQDATIDPGSTHASRGPILVAIIGVIGVLGAAMISNWDKLFPGPVSPRPSEPAPRPSEPAPRPSEPAPRPSEPTSTKAPAAERAPDITGTWRDVEYPNNRSQYKRDGDRFTLKRWGVLPSGDAFETTGSGALTGHSFSGTYTAKYRSGAKSTGNCSGTISPDEKHMTMTCSDSMLKSFPVNEIRE